MGRALPALLRWIVLAGYCAAIFAMSSSSHPPGADTAQRADAAIGRAISTQTHRRPRRPEVFDKLMHGAAFGIMSALAYAAIERTTRKRWHPSAHAAFAVTFTVVYGVTDELHQRSTPGRDSSLRDLAADTVGAVAASGALYAFARRRASAPQPHHRESTST